MIEISARLRLFAGAAMVALSGAALGQTFPAKPIKLIVGFAPGGGGDTGARVIAQGMTSSQPIVIENRPGAAGTIAAAAVARSAADGYTLLVDDHAATVYASALFKGLTYDPGKDLAVVSPIFQSPFLVLAGPALKASNLKELLEQARANPGRISYGHPGVGTGHHIGIELFKQRAGVDLASVAYKGGALAVQDTVGGQIQLVITSALPATAELIRAGRLRAIAVTAKTRLPNYPDAPALAEVVPGYEAATWVGIWAPAGTPRDVMQVLNGEFSKSLRRPDITKRFEEMGLEAIPRTLDETTQIWRNDLAVWPPAIKKMNITIE